MDDRSHETEIPFRHGSLPLLPQAHLGLTDTKGDAQLPLLHSQGVSCPFQLILLHLHFSIFRGDCRWTPTERPLRTACRGSLPRDRPPCCYFGLYGCVRRRSADENSGKELFSWDFRHLPHVPSHPGGLHSFHKVIPDFSEKRGSERADRIENENLNLSGDHL